VASKTILTPVHSRKSSTTSDNGVFWKSQETVFFRAEKTAVSFLAAAD
jgi:hypothetical protein